MKTAHTPGPWHVEPYQRDQGASLCVCAPNNGWIVCVISPDEDAGTLLPGDRENAALIAAAPDLLDTLQSFEDAFGVLVDQDADINGSDAVEFISGYLTDVRKALRIARGEETTTKPTRKDG